MDERTGVKVLFSLALIAAVWIARRVLLALSRRLPGGRLDAPGFWSRQGIGLAGAVVLALGLLSIWITPGADLTTGLGLLSAGLAFALSQVIAALAGYVVILRGDVFTAGDRIAVGDVRGDVVKIGFVKTTVLEMGQPHAVQDADPAVWVHSRLPTGRLVTVSNGTIFTEPVFNYSRELPFLWEEMAVAIPFDGDRAAAEAVLLDAARAHAVRPGDLSDAVRARMARVYGLPPASAEPRVFWRIAEGALEMSVRFLVPDRGVREIKDGMARRILEGLDQAGIPVAGASRSVVLDGSLRVRPTR